MIDFKQPYRVRNASTCKSKICAKGFFSILQLVGWEKRTVWKKKFGRNICVLLGMLQCLMAVHKMFMEERIAKTNIVSTHPIQLRSASFLLMNTKRFFGNNNCELNSTIFRAKVFSPWAGYSFPSIYICVCSPWWRQWNHRNLSPFIQNYWLFVYYDHYPSASLRFCKTFYGGVVTL